MYLVLYLQQFRLFQFQSYNKQINNLKKKGSFKPTVDLLIITIDGESVTSFVKPNELVTISTQICL